MSGPETPDSPPPVDLPKTEALEACLALLADATNVAGTMEIHDPLYLMLRDRDPEQLTRLRAALDVHSNHPAGTAVRSLLSAWLPQVERTVESVLAGDAPIPEGRDPLEELAQRLSDARRVRFLLEERVGELEVRLAVWMRTANVFAAVGALLAVLTIVGWMAALGALNIPWVDSPVLEQSPGEGDAQAVPTPSESEEESP